MKDHNKIEIEITTYPQFNLFGSLVPTAMLLALIGIGVAVESAAMQWAGFIMFFLFLTSIVHSKAEKNRGLTIEEAKRRIEEIERMERR